MKKQIADYKSLMIIPVMMLFLLMVTGCGGGGGGSESSGSALNGTVKLAWNPPADSDLAGYKVYYGTSYSDYTDAVDIGKVTTTLISDLTPGLWCFAIKAYDTSANESDYSNEACTIL